MAGARILVTPRAFLDLEGEHLNILKQAGYEIVANPRPRTLTEDEMAAYIVGMEGAKRALALGMNVLGFDMHPDVSFAEHHGIEYVPADELLKNSDIVTLHLGLNPETRGWLSKMRVGRIRPGAYLVNTGRPELIDEGAVLDARRGQRLRGAAFDLPSEENLFTVPLLTQENVLVSCHAGSNTEESVRRQAVMAAENVVAVLSGQPKLAAFATAS